MKYHYPTVSQKIPAGNVMMWITPLEIYFYKDKLLFDKNTIVFLLTFSVATSLTQNVAPNI